MEKPGKALDSVEDLPAILKIRDIASLLRISREHARRLPLKRIPGLGPRTIRFMREDVLEFLARPPAQPRVRHSEEREETRYGRKPGRRRRR